jgi:hypothetical protein
MTKLLLAPVVLGAAVLFFAAASGPSTAGGSGSILRDAALGEIEPATITVAGVKKTLPFISDGTLVAAQNALGKPEGDESENGDAGERSGSGMGFAPAIGCGGRNPGGNVRVNQDCTFRRQAEEDIAYNPTDPSNLLAGNNDSRVGYNQCGIAYSLNNGRTWGDLLPPFRQKLNDPSAQAVPTPDDPNRHTVAGGITSDHTYDAASDPSMTFDSQGRAFFSCVTFDVSEHSNATGLYVTQSPVGAKGSFFYNWTGRPWTVAEDNNGAVFHDKEFIVADTFASSPNRDNVYVTWTVFRVANKSPVGSPIFGSMSTDHGVHWSTPEEISGTSDALCVFGNVFDPTQSPHACNFDQGSDPAVLPNGDLVVVFNNQNTPGINGQQLSVRCHPKGDSAKGTALLDCRTPAKVGDDVATGEPECIFERGPEPCIPGPYIRSNDYPRIVTNTQNGRLYAVWQDYRNGEYDIQMSQSLDGGSTWHEVGTVNPDRGLDHYFPAVDQTRGEGDRVGVSSFRSERVPNENRPGDTFTGGALFGLCNADNAPPPGIDLCAGVGKAMSDYVLAGGTGARTPYAFRVLSPAFPPPDGIQTGFNGDYSGLVINGGSGDEGDRGGSAHPIWSDTRNADPYAPTNGVRRDEDVFTDAVGLPNGRARTSTGQIGRGPDRR